MLRVLIFNIFLFHQFQAFRSGHAGIADTDYVPVYHHEHSDECGCYKEKKTNMDRTVLLTTYSSPEEAAIVVGMLRSNGIPCEIENRNNLYVPIFNGVDIIVFEKDFERARNLIEQHQE